VLALAACAGTGSSDEAAPPAPPAGPYLGQDPIGPEPELFAPGRVSTGRGERDTAISADGDLLLHTVWGQHHGTIVQLEQRDGVWRGPTVVSFSGVFSDIEPAFDPAGDRLLFASQRPMPGKTAAGDWNLWEVPREAGAWGHPQPLDAVNSEDDEFYPSITRGGVLYFTASREDSLGGEDIYRAKAVDGKTVVENLGPEVNSAGPEFNAFIDPDERFLLFSSVRQGDQGGGDIYISYRSVDGSWSAARPLAAPINSAALDYCPFVTPDGRFLFFTSNRNDLDPDAPVQRDWERLTEDLAGPWNGLDSLWWVDAATALTP